MQSAHLEKIFYHYIDERPELENSVLSRFYDNAELRLAHEIRAEFRQKYSQPPTASQLKQIIRLKGVSEQLSDEKVEAIYDIKLSEYDPEWLESTAEAWIEYKTLDSSVIDLVTYLKTTKISAENVKDVVQTAKSLITDRNNVDFKFDEGSDFFDPEAHRQRIQERFSTGYNYLDTVLGGGYSPKTLLAFAGIPKVGKSMWLCNLSCAGVRSGYNVAYISLEMSESKIIKRLACNMLNIPSQEYNVLSEDSSYIKKKFSSITTDTLSIPGSLRVKEFPTSTASVNDVENWLKRMEERGKMKFKLVVIDYIGIMRNYRNPNSENSYMKIKQIAEDLRAMAMRNDWCIVTASQFNRGAYNTNDVVLEQIAESAALIHTVDGLFGIIQDEMMLMNSEYFLKTLANREEGYKNTKKRFTISYDYSRIMEDLNTEIINPQF
jgi:KaiC/GvpD/RAD55 family RecA-like ATPase